MYKYKGREIFESIVKRLRGAAMLLSLAALSFSAFEFHASAQSSFTAGEDEKEISESCTLPSPTPPKTKVKPKPAPKPKPKPVVIEDKEEPDDPMPPEAPEIAERDRKERAENESGLPAEKAIETDSKVNITLCVSEGNIKISGWDRNEVRAYVEEGSQVGFKILQKGEKPLGIKVLGFDPAKTKKTGLDECLSGENIELDVPKGATVNIIGTESKTTIKSLSKASVKTVSGDISLMDIENGADATTYEGDITAGRVKGAISLYSSSGSILAFDLNKNSLADGFKAKSDSGAITIQSVAHSAVEAVSTSGSLRYIGKLIEGGIYKFGTTNGSIILQIPSDSSCEINATYTFGSFHSDITLNNIQKNPTSQVRKLTASLGDSDASVTITTFNGSIKIKKK